MWIFSKAGFFSVVEDRADSDRIVVRARIRHDLHNLRAKYAPELSCVEVNYKRDYRYRAFISRAAWANAMSKMAMDLDYSNFKSMVDRTQGVDRHDLYTRVWGVMASAEHQLAYMAKERAPVAMTRRIQRWPPPPRRKR